MEGNHAPAYPAGIFLFLLLHKRREAVLFYKQAVFYQACTVPAAVAPVKRFYLLAWVFYAEKASVKPFFPRTVFNFTPAAVFRLARFTRPAPAARFLFE